MLQRIADARSALQDALSEGGARPLPPEANPFTDRSGPQPPEVDEFRETFFQVQEPAGLPHEWRSLGIRHLVALLDLIALRQQTTVPPIATIPADFVQRMNDLDDRYQQKAAELDRAKSLVRRDLHDFFAQAPIGICVLRGEEMRVELANPLYLELVGKDEGFIGPPLLDSLPELREQPISRILAEVYRTGTPYVGDELGVDLVRGGQREHRFFNFVYQPLQDPNGHTTGIIVVCSEVTAMVRAKMALTEKEKEFREIVTHSPVAICILKGPELTIEVANTTMLHTFWRRTDEEVVGRTLIDVFPELHHQPFIRQLQQVMQTGQPYRENEAEVFIDSHDGRKRFYVDYEYAPLLLQSDSTADGVICTVNDVTDKVRVRKLQETAGKRYSHLIETLPVGMYTIDKDGYIDLYNAAAVTIWGRHPVRGTDRWCGAFRLYSPQGTPIAHDECPMAMAFRSGRSLEEEIVMERENGERRHVIVHPRALYDEEGQMIGASKVMIDITERKRAEEALRASEAKFRLLTESIPQLIWTADALGNRDYFSDSFYRYAGKTPDQVARDGMRDVVHPDEVEENMRQWYHSIRSGDAFTFEHRFRRRDGQYRWHLTRAVPLRNDQGYVVQWVGTSTDIQDQKDFQQTLERLVEERTQELRRANTELENTNRELSSFAYISSHDLQEPLRKIQTFVSIILASDHANLSETGKKNFERMQLAANRMKALINDLLTYSRANNAEKVLEPTDLNLLLGDVAGEFAYRLEASGARLYIEDMPPLQAIPFQLRQLFTNLISNALKFARADVPPQIRITSEIVSGKDIGRGNVVEQQRYVHITVADNGIGFEPEYAAKIFEVFQRLHSRGEYEGTGIGLAICNKIVENHQGVLYAESTPGEGATFHIFVPL